MTVRPMTAHEMQRWPDAEMAFTIHYAEGDIKAHALTKIEDAEEFAQTIRLACVDARVAKEIAADPDFPKEQMRGRIMFVQCACGKLYTLNVSLILADEDQVGRHICPVCGLNLIQQGEEVPFDEGWSQDAKHLLPEHVTRHGKGARSYYTGLNGQRIER